MLFKTALFHLSLVHGTLHPLALPSLLCHLLGQDKIHGSLLLAPSVPDGQVELPLLQVHPLDLPGLIDHLHTQ